MKVRWATVFGVIACLGIAIGVMEPRMSLVRRGNAAELWDAALLLRERPAVIGLGMLERPVGDWLVYTDGGIDISFWHRVSVMDAEAGLGRALEQFEATRAATWRRAWIGDVVDRWKLQRGDARSLVAMLLDEREMIVHSQHPSIPNDADARQQAAIMDLFRRADRWWVTAGFEFLYLASVVLFAAWPWLRQRKARVWAIHAGMLPLFLFLPMWMGYGILTYTSIAPFGGGIVYPWLLLIGRGLCGDGYRAPMVMWLEPVSLVPSWGLGSLPVPLLWVIVAWGVVAGMCVGALRWGWERWMGDKPRVA